MWRRAWRLLALLGVLGFHTEAGTAVPPDVPQGTFVAATLNLWHDQRDWPARMAVILDALRALEPDVIFLQEVLQKEGLPNQAQALADSLEYEVIFASVDPPGAPKRYGNAILAHHPMVATHEVKLAPLDDYRVAAHVRLAVHGRLLDAYVTHLHHTTEGDSIRARQVLDLLAFMDTTRAPGALLLGGDFNAAPDAPELRPIQERLADTYALLHPGEATPPITTLNIAMGHSPRRIDYIFAGPDHLQTVASEIFLDAPTTSGVWASDHFGVWTRFRWADQ